MVQCGGPSDVDGAPVGPPRLGVYFLGGRRVAFGVGVFIFLLYRENIGNIVFFDFSKLPKNMYVHL